MVVKPDLGQDDIQTSFSKPIDIDATKSRSSSAKSDVGDPLDLFPRHVRFRSFADLFDLSIEPPVSALLNRDAPVQSILKIPAGDVMEAQRQYIRALEAEKARCMEVMLAGTVMLKYNSKGKPDARFVRISPDGTELIWSKTGLPRTRSRRFNLACVRGIVFGPNTIRFLRFDWENSKPWMCFSLVCENRTVDLCMENERDFVTWYLGLQHLIPLPTSAQTRGSLLWTRAIYKVSQRAYKGKTTQLNVWMDLFYQAKRDCAAATTGS
jgi:hypothetical protein